jgi:hypothetical protein
VRLRAGPVCGIDLTRASRIEGSAVNQKTPGAYIPIEGVAAVAAISEDAVTAEGARWPNATSS